MFTQLTVGAIGGPIFLANTGVARPVSWLFACVTFVLGFVALRLLARVGSEAEVRLLAEGEWVSHLDSSLTTS